MKTLAQITTSMLQVLQDTGAATWGAAETTEAINMTKIEVAKYIPHEVRHTLTTTADSRELSLGKINNLLRVLELEYKVAKDPRKFRNFIIRGQTLSMLIDTEPAAGETVYLYIAKPHVLMATTDLVGAVDLVAGYAAGATTIHVDGLAASDTLEEDSVFTIAGLSGSYRLTAATTLATNEGDITFDPGLAAAVLDDAVVTFYASTLFDPRLENAFIKMAVAYLKISKATLETKKVPVGGGNPWERYLADGNAELGRVQAELEAMTPVRSYTEYPRD